MVYLIVVMGYVLMEFQVLEMVQVRIEEIFTFKFLISIQNIRFHFGTFKNYGLGRIKHFFLRVWLLGEFPCSSEWPYTHTYIRDTIGLNGKQENITKL